jgi:uncharacterized protein
MLCVRCYVSNSIVHGMGVFASQFIAKGTEVWKFDPRIDSLLSPEQVQERQTLRYVFWDNKYQAYIKCGDAAIFTNHSFAPNVGYIDGKWGALRDITAHEEIYEDYTSFDVGPLDTTAPYLEKPSEGNSNGR